MSFVKEFKEFAARGNVVDMAVGIVIGASFGKIVSSLVADVIMPPLGLVIGGINFSNLKLTLKEAAVAQQSVALNYGMFIQAVFDFVIVAFAMFILVKGINKLKRSEEKPVTPQRSAEALILTEIRDILKKEA